MPKKENIENIRKNLFDKGFVLLSKEYITNKKPLLFEDFDGFLYNLSYDALNSAYRNNGKVKINIVDKRRGDISVLNISRWININIKSYVYVSGEYFNNSDQSIEVRCLKCKETWFTSWSEIKRKYGCPRCSNHRVSKHNNFEFLFPQMSKEWNYEKNFPIKPSDIVAKTSKKYWWKCSFCGYDEWIVSPNSRVSGKGCPSCSGRVVSDKNRLSILYPEIAAEWHPTKNGDLTPDDVSYGSAKKAWWICRNGHDYFSKICDRTNGKGCKKCSDSQRESKIANELKSYILNKYNGKEEYLIFRNPETNRYLPFDIYVFGGRDPKINGIYIEIHWNQHYMVTFHHKQLSRKKGTTPEEEFEYQKHKDRLKRRFARKNGTYIEIDLRKIKTTEQAVEYIENIFEKNLFYE